jgi:hypothetical protein
MTKKTVPTDAPHHNKHVDARIIQIRATLRSYEGLKLIYYVDN